MSEVTLEEQIEKRKKQAERRKLSLKAEYVAKYLGKSIYNSYSAKTIYRYSGNNYLIIIEYEHGSVSNSVEAYGGMKVERCNIWLSGVVVYEAGGSITIYIPGRKWEAQLNTLYKEAVTVSIEIAEKAAEKKEDIKTENEAKERAKWGL